MAEQPRAAWSTLRPAGQSVRTIRGFAPVLLVAAAAAAGNPTLLLLALLASTAAVLRRWLPRDLTVPVAAAMLLTAATAVGLLAAAAGVDLLMTPSLPAVSLSVLVILMSGAAAWTQRQAPAAGEQSPGTWVAQVPAGIAAMTAVVQSFDVQRVASWMFTGTDFAEHAVMTARLQEAGSLSYAAEVYPRGAHMLLALVSTVGLPAEGSAALLSHDLRLMAGATWLALAGVLWAVSALVLRVAASLGLPTAWRVGAALVAGLALLGDGAFMFVFVSMAAAPGLSALLMLLVVPLAVLGLPSGLSRWRTVTVLALISAVALAHLWPALLPVPAVGWLAYASSRAERRSGGVALSSIRRSPRVLLIITAAAAAIACIGAPLAALWTAGGLALAGIEGELSRPSTALLALGLGSLAVVSRRQSDARVLVGTTAGSAVVVVALLVGAGTGLGFDSYYPRKGLWFATVVLLPLAVAVSTWIARAVALRVSALVNKLGRQALLARTIALLVAIAAAGAYGLPPVVSTSPLDRLQLRAAGDDDRRRLAIVMNEPQRYSPAVVVPVALGLRPIPSPYDTYVISKLLRLRTGQPQTHGRAERVCDVVREVAGGDPAIVLTDLEERVLGKAMTRQGCGHIRVVQVPGGNAGAIRFVQMQLVPEASGSD